VFMGPTVDLRIKTSDVETPLLQIEPKVKTIECNSLAE
jgi:hypothetical protein